MGAVAVEKDLLFGLLALQVGLIDQAALVAAFHAWTQDKARPLADHLVALGHLDAAHRPLLEGLAAAHLARNGGNLEQSLAAIPAGRSTRESLAQIGDPDMTGTLARVGSGVSRQDGDSDADRTATYSVGAATSDGQRFRVLRPHARGGLGAVFVALDAELHREVALKQILDSHADDLVSRQRFVREAEVTGGLEHPGIVPVYGLGTYGNGRPYYATRFIRGDSLKAAIDRFHTDGALESEPGRRSLELRKLLRRFTDVCNAIDYAHSRGVLHRDIKPGNIIIGKHGETLVVDWGLAKARGQAESGESSEERPLLPSSASGSAETLPGSALGTPAYMSPEQAQGDLEHLGPRSDVYSLGATLYCLLTGRPPFEGDVATVIPAVQRGGFPPPRKVDSTIDPALDAVCQKAMARKPADRYGSTRALAEDVDRWMADEPVTAYREPASVRLTRWGRRHRPLVAGAAALLVAAVVGLTVGAVLLGRANSRTERQRRVSQANFLAAEFNFHKAREAVDEYFTKVSQSKLLNVPGLQPLRKELLESAQKYYQDFLRDRGGDPTVRADAAEAWYRLGSITHDIGSPSDALDQLQKSEGLYEALARDQPDEIRHLYKLAMCLNDICRLHHELGSVADWLAAILRATAIREEVVRREPAVPEYQKELAISYANLGLAYTNQGKLDDAIESLRKSLQIYERLIQIHPESVDYRRRLNYVDTILGQDEADIGRADEGLRRLHRAVADAETLIREHPGELLNADRLLWSLYALGLMQIREARQPEEILKTYRRLSELTERLLGENPTYNLYRQHRVEALARIGEIQSDLGRADEARSALERACELGRDHLRDDPSNVWVRQSLAYASMALGGLRRFAGRDADAADLFRQSFELFEALAGIGSLPIYERATSHALCAALIAKLPASENPERGRRHAVQAVAMLQKSVANGFLNIDMLLSDPDLVAIRSRADFQSLIQDLRRSRASIAPSDAGRPVNGEIPSAVPSPRPSG
jgi:eukaryotic-like serine/threonine-protein kinase